MKAIRILGNGGYGKVVEAMETETGNRVAVKIYEKGARASALVEHKVLTEIATQNHPNIVRLIDLDYSQKIFCKCHCPTLFS